MFESKKKMNLFHYEHNFYRKFMLKTIRCFLLNLIWYIFLISLLYFSITVILI